MNLPPQLAHLRHDRVRRLAAYWLGLRRGRAMPAFRDIDPTEIPYALSQIWVVDLMPEGDIRFRLVGDTVARLMGFYPGGQRLTDAFPPDMAAQMRALAAPLVIGALIGHQVGAVHQERNRRLSGERIVLPLSDDGESVTNLLGLTVHDAAEPRGPIRFDLTLPATYTPVSELPAT